MPGKNWIKPPNTLVRKGPDGTPHKLSYWVDKNGKYQLYTKEQLATLNILTNLNLTLIRSLILLDTLKKMDANAKIKTLVQKEYPKFEAAKSSIFNHFIALMAAVPNITFGEFLGFLTGGSDPQTLVKMGQKTLQETVKGKSSTVDVFYTSDHLKEH